MRRKYLKLIAIAFFTVAFVSGCSKDESDSYGGDYDYAEKISLNTRQDVCNDKLIDFAYDMIEVMETSYSKGNQFCVSPLSVEFTLGMIANASSEDVRKVICEKLGSENLEDLNSYAKIMLENMPALDKKTDLKISNLVLADNSFSLADQFKNNVETNYMAEIANKDFHSSKTMTYVNDWITKKTGGKIKELFKSDVLFKSSFIFANAIYFKGPWANRLVFDKVQDQDFITARGNSVKLEMLETKRDDLNIQEYGCYRTLVVPFGNYAFEFRINLPDEGVSCADMIKEIKTHGQMLRSTKTSLARFPKFVSSYSVDLTDFIRVLGLEEILSNSLPELSNGTNPAFIDYMKQRCVVEVTEKGVEAATVTGVGGIGKLTTSQEFIADRPFIYTITEKSTGAVLFAGKFSGE